MAFGSGGLSLSDSLRTLPSSSRVQPELGRHRQQCNNWTTYVPRMCGRCTFHDDLRPHRDHPCHSSFQQQPSPFLPFLSWAWPTCCSSFNSILLLRKAWTKLNMTFHECLLLNQQFYYVFTVLNNIWIIVDGHLTNIWRIFHDNSTNLGSKLDLLYNVDKIWVLSYFVHILMYLCISTFPTQFDQLLWN